jgi:CrcB protein
VGGLVAAWIGITLGTGFCGAYTTFSTFTFDTVRLLEDGAGATAFVDVALSVVGGLAAAGAGLAVAARW